MPKLLLKKIDAEAEVNEVTIFRRFQNKKNLVEKTKINPTSLLVHLTGLELKGLIKQTRGKYFITD